MHDGGFPSTYLAHDYTAGIQQDRVLARAYQVAGGIPRVIQVDVDGEPPTGLMAQLEARARAAAV